MGKEDEDSILQLIRPEKKCATLSDGVLASDIVMSIADILSVMGLLLSLEKRDWKELLLARVRCYLWKRFQVHLALL